MPPLDTGLPPAFFRSLASTLLDDIKSGAAREEVEAHIAGVLKETFESGMSSTLVSVVSAIEAVRVPRAGMVLFKAPDLTTNGYRALRRDIGTIAQVLEERLGFKPILLVVPADIEAQVVDFAADEGEGGELVRLPHVEPPARPRFVALDPLKLRDRIVDVLANDIDGTVTVFAVGSATADGRATHDVRVVLPASVLRSDEVPYEVVADITEAVEGYAVETNAAFNVVVGIDGRPVTDESPAFSVTP